MAFNMLIVDDNAVFRMGLAARLKQEGYQVKEAGTGKDALRNLESETYDLILTDLILTGYGDVSSAVEALQIGAVDEEGRISYISSSIKRILGYDPEEMIGHHYLEFVFPEDKESVRAFTEKGKPSIHTNRLRSRDGKIVWIRFSDSPVKEDLEMGAFYTVLTDVTTKKKLQEELIKKEARTLAGELAAFAAHDINTPLQDVLFQHRNWKVESTWEGETVYVAFHNMDLRTISGEDYSGKYSTIHGIIKANDCSLSIEGLPGDDKTLIIGVPRVENA